MVIESYRGSGELDMGLLEIAVRTLCDVPVVKCVDTVFLFSQTRENQGFVLTAAHKLVAEKR